MYIGLAADPTWIQEVFGVQTAAQIDIDKTRLLDRETPASQRVRTVIGMSDYIASTAHCLLLEATFDIDPFLNI